MSTQVSIIIVNYNVKELLHKCIHSIYATTNITFEIILIDNNSTDGSILLIRKDFPQVIIIENNYNAGFPKANNQGFERCTGKYLLMLNPDTECIGNAIDLMFNYMENHIEVSLLAPKLLNTNGSIQYSIQRFITVSEVILETFFLHSFYKSYHSYLKKTPNAPLEVEALSGAAILFPKALYNEIGGLDEDLFWTEDMEFCYRAYKHGKKIIYIPQAEIKHHIGASGFKNMNVMISRQVLSKITFFRKNHSTVSFTLVKYARLLHIITRIIIFYLLSLTGRINFRKKLEAYTFTFSEFKSGHY